MGKVNESVWNVEFVGDYFQLISTVIADDEEQAVKFATDLLKKHYGFDMDNISNEISAYEVAQ
jgi:hypothetical protein